MKSKLHASRLANQNESISFESRSDAWPGSSFGIAPSPQSAVGPVPQNTVPTTSTIAFTALQADNSGGGANGDYFQFVLLEAVTTGTTIYFTDSGYRTDTSSFRTNETMMRWVAQANLPAGTLVSFTAPGGTAIASTAEWTGINMTTGATTATATLTLAAGGENIIALIDPVFGGADLLTGTAIAAVTQNPIFAATWTGASGNASTALPPGLTDGVNAVSVATFDNSRYNGTTTGTAADLRTAINNDANWTGSNTPLSPQGVASFTVTGGGLPTLTVDDVAMAEGDAGTVTFFFTVSLSAPAGPGGVTFDIATADGSATDDNPATEDNDYVPISLTGQTIPAGSSTYSFQVTVNGDNAPEINETFFVNVTNVTGATVGDGQGQGTITNDDTPGTLSIGDVTLAEGNSGNTAFSFTVTRSGGSEGAVGATWTLNLPGGANADAGDFDAGQLLTGSVSFADGDTSETIVVQVKGDALVEPDEGFTITLSAPTGGATIGDDTGAGTITNDDSPPVASIADAALAEGDDGVTYLVFTVTLDHASNGTVTYDYDTAGGSATEDGDYLGLSGQVSFAPGETSQTIRVPIVGDEAPENNETLTVTLSNPSGGTIGDGVATGTITNDDGSGYYALAGGSFSQNWTNVGQITANDSWSGVPYIIGYLGDIDGGSSTNVDPRTLTGAALGNIDVIANLSVTTSVSGGVGEFEIANPVVGLQGSGTADAPSLVLYMDASGRTNVRLQATLRDIDNSAPGGVEDNAAQQINVQYRTSPGGAWTNAPGGYFADVTTLGLAPNTTLDVTLPADANNAATLEIRIMTTNAAGNDEWVGIDDIVVSSQQSGPILSIANAAVIEGDAGPTIITFTVTRAGSSTGAVTADWAATFGGGPFDAGASDFTALTPLAGQVSFADGETSTTVTLSVDGDVGPEGDENFTITLSNPSAGAAIGDGAATGTIVNDDGPPPLVTINDVTIAEGDSGTSLMTFTITRTGGTGAFDVDWETVDGSATAGEDYVANSGTVHFADGQTSDTVTVAVTINGDTSPELGETLQVLLSNATNFALITDATGVGTIAGDDPIFIHDIQGTAYFSPILAAEGISGFNIASAGTVIVRAVVTAIDNDGPRQGFYLQEELADWDANSFTSEGIFVATGATVSGVAVGDIVTVTARVMEYQGFSSNMPVTTLTSPSSIVVNSSGNALPAFTLSGGSPSAIMTLVQPDYSDSADGVGDTFDASLYALSYWETVEGMLVTMPDMVVADGFFNSSGGQPIFQAYSQAHADADQINDRGGYTIAGDPPIGPPDTGETVDDTIAGGRHLTDGDVNPDIIEVDFSGFAVDAPVGFSSTLSMGDYLGDITGIVDFDFTDRKLFVTDYTPGTFVNNTTTQDTTALGNDVRALTVATFNVENLDPGDALSKFQGLAQAIADNLNMPDIISIEEMQDNNGATAGDGIDDDPNTLGMQDATGADASQTWQMLVDALNALTGANYQWVDEEPDYNAEGGEQSGNIRVGFLYNTDRVQLGGLDANATLEDRRRYTDRIGDSERDSGDLIAFDDDMLGTEIQIGDWAGTRRSLLGEFTFNGNIVYVAANHFPAKSQSDDFWEFNQNPAAGEPTNAGWTQRNNVSQDVYAMLDLIETGAPGSGIVSGGDYNDFYFYRPMTTVTGYTMADGTARVGGSRFDNLTLTLTEAERYTYNFDGRSQAIDHIIVNSTLSGVATYDIVHLNTGFNPGDSTPLSDHDPGLSSFDFREFSELLTGTAGADLINGYGGNDTIRTLGGNDVLIGGAGTDQLEGGAGDDVYHADDDQDHAVELAGEGTDIVYASVSYQLDAGSEVEILSTSALAGTAAIDLTGNEIANLIYGNAGANALDGGGGADVLVGLGGNDVYHVDNAGDLAVEGAGGGVDIVYASTSYELAGGSEIEVLSTGFQAGTAALALIGNDLANLIYGNAGANILAGGGGADVLVGFGGNDVYFVDEAGDRAIEGAGEGTDVVYAGASFRLDAGSEVEILSAASLAGTAAIDLTGNELANILYGNAGNNALAGGGGADAMIGLGGDDVYFVDDAGDRAIEGAGEGSDIVYAAASWQLEAGSAVEVLSTASNGGTEAIDLAGNELSNTLYGNAGANVLNGGAGADALIGFGGADSFAFTTALGGGNVDLLADFVSGTDEILLDDAVFSGLGLGALNANAFVAGSAAQDADDRIVYDQATGALYYDADGNGAGAAVQFAALGGNPVIAASDFTVI